MLTPSYELRTDQPDEDEVVLACVAPHAAWMPALYSLHGFRLLSAETEHLEAMPLLSPVMGWLPLPVTLGDLWS